MAVSLVVVSDRWTTSRTVLGGIALLLVLGVLGFVAGGPGADGPPDNPLAGSQATAAPPTTLDQRPAATDVAPLPDFELPAFDGDGVIRAADYQGRPLVVNFWASWCAPCVEEMPALQEVAAGTDGKLAFLGVNTEDFERDKAAALVAETGVRYDLAVDRDGSLARATQLFGMPTTLLVDADGMIVYRHTGALTAGQLRELLRRHLDVRV